MWHRARDVCKWHMYERAIGWARNKYTGLFVFPTFLFLPLVSSFHHFSTLFVARSTLNSFSGFKMASPVRQEIFLLYCALLTFLKVWLLVDLSYWTHRLKFDCVLSEEQLWYILIHDVIYLLTFCSLVFGTSLEWKRNFQGLSLCTMTGDMRLDFDKV